MPVESQHLNALAMLLADFAEEGEDEHGGQADDSEQNVRGMQADQRIKRGSEKIGGDGEVLVIDKVLPLESGSDQEDHAENKSERPEGSEELDLVALKRALREPDGEAAGEQADGTDDGNLEDVSRLGSVETFPDIEDVGNDEDGEDGRLADDEAEHGDAPARRQVPFGGRGRCVGNERGRAHYS